MFAECPRAQEVWRRVLRWWGRCTGEQLSAQDKRVALVGDRSHTWKETQFGQLAEPFAIVHGVTLEELRLAREYSRIGAGGERSAAKIVERIRRRIAGLANARAGQIKRLSERQHPSAEEGKVNSAEAYEAAWVDSGLVKRVRGQGRVRRARQ